MTLQLDSQHLTITSCKQIVVSDIEPDEVLGYVRRVIFYDQPASVENRTPVLEIMLDDVEEESLKVQTPALDF